MNKIYLFLILIVLGVMSSCEEESTYPKVHHLEISQTLYTEFDPSVTISIKAPEDVSSIDVAFPQAPATVDGKHTTIPEVSLANVPMESGQGSLTINRSQFPEIDRDQEYRLISLSIDGSNYDFYYYSVKLTSALSISAPAKLLDNDEVGTVVKGVVNTGTPAAAEPYTLTAEIKKGDGMYEAVTLDDEGGVLIKGADFKGVSKMSVKYTLTKGEITIVKEAEIPVKEVVLVPTEKG